MKDKANSENVVCEWEFGEDWFKELQAKIKFNEYQSEYYERMFEDFHDFNYLKKAERTLSCSRIWDLNYYKKHGIKQVKSISRCQDAFCYVCQTLKANRRFQVFSPALKELEKSFDIYHTVFTVPNVSGRKLKWTLDKMYNRFSRLVAYFNGDKKIKGLDFEQYGYKGAVRALEITTGKREFEDDFHPHFHCMFVFEKNSPNMEKEVYNSFSLGKYDFVTEQKKITYFSKFEWLLQRIWCLLMLDLKVTRENIVDIYAATDFKYKDGFDVKSDNADGQYHEIFKYAIKGTYKKEKIFMYEDFCCLEDALKDRRVYETYGCLRELNFNKVDENGDFEDWADALFNVFLRELQSREKPYLIQSCIEEILDDLKGNSKRKKRIRYIGPSVLRRMFGELPAEGKEAALEKMREVFFA